MFLNDNIYQVRLKQNLLQWLKLYNLNVMGHITNNTVPGLITYKHFFLLYIIKFNTIGLIHVQLNIGRNSFTQSCLNFVREH